MSEGKNLDIQRYNESSNASSLLFKDSRDSHLIVRQLLLCIALQPKRIPFLLNQFLFQCIGTECDYDDRGYGKRWSLSGHFSLYQTKYIRLQFFKRSYELLQIALMAILRI